MQQCARAGFREGVSEGMKAKQMRIAKGLRQLDVASAAKVDTIDVTRLEKGRYVLPPTAQADTGRLGHVGRGGHQ